MKRHVGVCGVLSISLLLATGCQSITEDNEAINKAILVAQDSVESAKEAAKQSIDYLGETLNLNGDYASGTEALKAYADEFKATVRDKLESIDPKYVEILDEQIANAEQVKQIVKDSLQETQVENTESYKYFNNFDYNAYDITYCVYAKDEKLIRNRVVKNTETGNLNAYCSSYSFSMQDKDAFDVLGLVYRSCENNIWYECNQLKQEKKLTDYPTAYINIDYLLRKYNTSSFKSSTLNNMVKIMDGMSADRFVDGDSDVTFVYKQGMLSAILVNLEKDPTIILINDIKTGTANIENSILTASKDYKVIE